MTGPGRILPATLLLGLLAALVTVGLRAGSSDSSAFGDFVSFDVRDHRLTAVREFTVVVDGTSRTTLERLECPGDGESYRLTLLEMNHRPRARLSPAQQELFDRLQEEFHSGGGERVLFQRDFRILDADLFLDNYRIVPIQGTAPADDGTLADASVTFQVLPIVPIPDRPFWEVTMSVMPGRRGFPLRYREYSYGSNGMFHVVSEMKVVELDYGVAPDLPAGSSPVVSRHDCSGLDEALSQLSIPLFVPTWLPRGFRLLDLEIVTLRTDGTEDRVPADVEILRMVYSDGVDRVDVLQHEPSFAGLLKERNQTPLAAGPLNLIVPVYRFGSISSAFLVLPASQIVVESRTSTERFTRIVRSLRQVL